MSNVFLKMKMKMKMGFQYVFLHVLYFYVISISAVKHILCCNYKVHLFVIQHQGIRIQIQNSAFIYFFCFLIKMLGRRCSAQVKVDYLLLFFHSVFMSGVAPQWYWTIEATVWIIVMAITLYCTPWLHRVPACFVWSHVKSGFWHTATESSTEVLWFFPLQPA